MGFPPERICLAVNRCGRPGAVAPEAVARALDRPLGVALPEDPAAVEAINLGRPLLLHRSRAPFAAAVERLAGRLAAAGLP
jgi:Flp pilus assembly CpaE family ATPase